jgi:hypothetical protein
MIEVIDPASTSLRLSARAGQHRPHRLEAHADVLGSLLVGPALRADEELGENAPHELLGDGVAGVDHSRKSLGRVDAGPVGQRNDHPDAWHRHQPSADGIAPGKLSA